MNDRHICRTLFFRECLFLAPQRPRRQSYSLLLIITMSSVIEFCIDKHNDTVRQCNFKQCPFILLIVVPATRHVHLSGGSECSVSKNRIDFTDEQNWTLLDTEKVPQFVKSLQVEFRSDTWGHGKGILPC